MRPTSDRNPKEKVLPTEACRSHLEQDDEVRLENPSQRPAKLTSSSGWQMVPQVKKAGIVQSGASTECPTPLPYHFTDLGFLKGRIPNDYEGELVLTANRELFRFMVYSSTVVNWREVEPAGHKGRITWGS